MKLRDIIYDKDCYVYSTSYRFCISQFAFAPSTTVGPMNLDFSKAVNITWNRKDRNLLPLLLHHKVCEAARIWGLDRLHQLAVLAFAYPGGRAQEGLQILAEGARQAGDYFPFSADTMSCMRLFVPTKWPSHNQLEEARAVWSRGVAKAQEAKETRQERTVRVGDYCRFKPSMTSVTMWRMWEDGLIDLAAGDIVKVVTTPENGTCYVNKPGKCPILATMELVDPEWLELADGKFEECEYCGAIEHETSDCPYRGKVPYGRKGDFSWRVEGGKMFFDEGKPDESKSHFPLPPEGCSDKMNTLTQKELDQVIRIDPNQLKSVAEQAHKVHHELNDWLTTSSEAKTKTYIEMWDSLLAHKWALWNKRSSRYSPNWRK